MGNNEIRPRVVSKGVLENLLRLYVKVVSGFVKYEEVAGSGKSQVSFSQVDVERAGHYAAEDADIAMRLHEKIYPQLQLEPALCILYL